MSTGLFDYTFVGSCTLNRLQRGCKGAAKGQALCTQALCTHFAQDPATYLFAPCHRHPGKSSEAALLRRDQHQPPDSGCGCRAKCDRPGGRYLRSDHRHAHPTAGPLCQGSSAGVVEVAAAPGFEPRQRDSESLVLPLHHAAFLNPMRIPDRALRASGYRARIRT